MGYDWLTNSVVIVSGEQRRDSATHIHVFSSVVPSCPTLQSHELQHARPPWPAPTLGIYSNSCTCIHSPPNLPSIQVATFFFNVGKFLTPLPMCDGSFPTPSNSPAPPGCPTIQLKSDSLPRGSIISHNLRAQPHKTAPHFRHQWKAQVLWLTKNN